jgi:flagellar basal-body rod protein FlgG
MIDSVGAAMQAQWHRHEVLANNLANLSTAGFKRDDIALTSSALPGTAAQPALVPAPPLPPAQSQFWTDFAPGNLRETGRPLDVALNGRGFLVVQTAAGPRYTRSGGLDVARDGTLVLPGVGPVLGERGAVPVRGERLSISPQGEVRDGDRVVDRLRVVDFASPAVLRKQGQGLFALGGPRVEPTPVTDPAVVGGALESSNVDPVGTMVAMIEVHRLYEAYQRVVQAADETDGRAVNDVGSVR